MRHLIKNGLKRYKNTCAVAFVLLFWLLAAADSYAHPHVFIDPKVKMVFNKKKLVRIKVEWTFDDLTSTAILNMYDKNKNKKIERAEWETIKKNTFDNFGQFHYFTFIEIDGKRVSYPRPKNFKVKVLKGNILFYSFDVKVGRNVGKFVKLWFSDKTNYTAFELMKKNVFVKVNGGSPPNVSMKMENYKDKAVLSF